jgi:hypothetical protein
MMDRVLADLNFVFVYLDDIIVASQTETKHLQYLHLLLHRLSQFGLVIISKKCVFSQASVDFLGHRVSAQGALPLRSHVQAILDFPQPQLVKQLQGFLVSVNFYRRFLPRAAKFLKPLTDSLKGSLRPTDRLQWSPEMLAAFQAVKAAVAKATFLVQPFSWSGNLPDGRCVGGPCEDCSTAEDLPLSGLVSPRILFQKAGASPGQVFCF